MDQPKSFDGCSVVAVTNLMLGTEQHRSDLAAFRRLAEEARLLKAGRLNVSDDLVPKFAGMGKPNYQVRRLIFALAKLAK